MLLLLLPSGKTARSVRPLRLRRTPRSPRCPSGMLAIQGPPMILPLGEAQHLIRSGCSALSSLRFACCPPKRQTPSKTISSTNCNTDCQRSRSRRSPKRLLGAPPPASRRVPGRVPARAEAGPRRPGHVPARAEAGPEGPASIPDTISDSKIVSLQNPGEVHPKAAILPERGATSCRPFRPCHPCRLRRPQQRRRRRPSPACRPRGPRW